RLVRFELRPGRGGAGRQRAARRGASPSLSRQMALAESTQRGLETSPPQAEGGGAASAALAEFRRSVAALLGSL
ncbi:MAG: hypothetical protein ACRES6_09110, partial [Steroidobacteraceae bacterium]